MMNRAVRNGVVPIWLLAVVAAAGGVRAQSSVRGWGAACFDTEALSRRVRDIDLGHLRAAVVRNDGRIFMSGVNAHGCSEPPPPAPGLQYVKVRTGYTANLALRADGTVIAWGLWSQRIVGSAGWVRVPVPVPPLPPGTRCVDLDIGLTHALLLRSDGVIQTLGDNDVGQCDVPPIAAGVTVDRVLANDYSSMAMLSDGTILAWGANDRGQLNVPPLPQGMWYVDMAMGGSQTIHRHSLAVRSDGALLAWGDNPYGEINVPPLPPGLRYLRTAAGDSHSLAWRSDGSIVCWGDNFVGQCDPPPVPQGARCVRLVGGPGTSMALLSTGEVLAWGHNTGYASYVPSLPRNAQGEPSAKFRQIAGLGQVATVLSDGTILGWGGRTTLLDPQLPPPGPKEEYVRVGAGAEFNVALTRSGRLVAWGTTYAGRTNVPPLPPGVVYTDMSVGQDHTVALRSDGHAVQFGGSAQPVPPPSAGVSYVDAKAANAKTALLRSDGVVVCLGSSHPSLLQVPPLPPGIRYEKVASADSCHMALRSDGEIEIWGSLGGWYWLPKPALPPGVNYVEVAGGHGLLARRSDGQVVAFGTCVFREELVPPLDPGTSYVEVAAGICHIARVGPTSTYVTFASGCAGSRPAARLIPMDTPRIGHTLAINLFDLPANAAFVGLGWYRQPPLALDGVGMPGCALHISIDDVSLVTGQGGNATYRLTIPDRPELIGLRFHQQALVLDPAAGNGAGAVASNAAEGVVGDW